MSVLTMLMVSVRSAALKLLSGDMVPSPGPAFMLCRMLGANSVARLLESILFPVTSCDDQSELSIS